MSFMLALPKISLHGAGAIGDMVKLVAGKQWGKALIVTDGHLVKMGLLDSLFAALDAQQMSYHLFDEVFPNPTEALVQNALRGISGSKLVTLLSPLCGSPIDTAKAVKTHRQSGTVHRLLRRRQGEKRRRAAGGDQHYRRNGAAYLQRGDHRLRTSG